MMSTPTVCRTCLQKIDDDCPKFYLDFIESTEDVISIRFKLGACFPELHLDITSNPAICNDCFSAVKFIYDFKKKCLETETRLQELFQGNHFICNSTTVNLHEALEFNERKQSVIDNQIMHEEKCKRKKGSRHVIQQLEIVDIDSVVFNTKADNFTESGKPNLSVISDNETIDSKDNLINCKNEYLPTEVKTQINIKRIPSWQTSKKKSETIKTHTASKPFKCEECKHISKTKGNLKMHMKIHYDNKQFKCTECNYQSIQKQHLVVHMRRHMGVKPYKCTECQYSCRQPTNLNSHVKRYH